MTRFWGLTATVWFIVIVALPTAAVAQPPAESAAPDPSAAPSPTTAPPDSSAVTPPAETPPADQSEANEAPAPEKPVESAAPLADVPPKKGLPRLHIDADRPGVRLLRIDRVMSDDMGEGILVSNVCSAPCDQIIDAKKRRTFFFGADGMVPSRGFTLSRLEGDVVARVEGGSLVARQVGFLLGGFGGVAVIGGITMLGVGYAKDATHLSGEGKVVEGPNPNLTTGGFVALGVGAAMVTTAIVLIATAKTKFTLVQDKNKSALVTWEAGAVRF